MNVHYYMFEILMCVQSKSIRVALSTVCRNGIILVLKYIDSKIVSLSKPKLTL
jgi:hypothetical protein